MSSKRRQRRKACEGKKKFSSLESAVSARYLILHDSGTNMWAYKCNFCNGYHLGHPNKRLIRSMKAILRNK